MIPFWDGGSGTVRLMRLGVCCTDALGWRSVRLRWAACLPLAFDAVEEFAPERFGNPYLRRGLRTLAKNLATRRAVAEALRSGCDRVLVATNGEATLLPPRWAGQLAIYGDASHRQLNALYEFGRPERKMAAHDRALRGLAQAGCVFLAMSHWCAEGLVRDYGARSAVLPPPLDTVRFRPAGSPGDGVLFVGGDFERKGGPEVLEAARALPNTVFSLVTSWAGPVPSNVRLLGQLSPDSRELVTAYQAAGLVTLPTRADCYSHVIAEAHACGLPVVASLSGGIGDLLRDGCEGLVAPARDPSALAAAIAVLAGDPVLRARLGAAGRVRAVTDHDPATHSARLRAAIE